jgi:hypothetical protein
VIRVVTDTNAYVSAIIFGGNCEAILALARAGAIELFVCLAIANELRFVLGRTFGWTGTQVREAIAEAQALASIVRPSVRLSGILAHASDHRILECALVLLCHVIAPRMPG